LVGATNTPIFDVRAYVLVVVAALYLIYACLHCLLGEEDEEEERKEKDDKDDTDLEERDPDPEEWNRRYLDEQLGPDLEFARMLSLSKMATWQHDLDALKDAGFNASFGKHFKENPPEVGDAWCTFTATKQ
jgi:hypothetical protein